MDMAIMFYATKVGLALYDMGLNPVDARMLYETASGRGSYKLSIKRMKLSGLSPAATARVICAAVTGVVLGPVGEPTRFSSAVDT